MQSVQAGVLYFVLTFAAGFVFGVLRVLLVVPRLGIRTAELLETPLMLAVTFLAAIWVVRRLRLPARSTARIGMGLIALGLMLTAEFSVVLAVRGMTVRQYFAERDPVSGTVYVILLVVFALMPVFVARNETTNHG